MILFTENWEGIEDYRVKRSAESTNLRDIQDGTVYQIFLESVQPEARERKVFSIVISSDGAPLIKSRKFSV